MIEPLAGESQTGLNILRFEVRQFFQHLRCSQAVGEEVEYIGHADPHYPLSRWLCSNAA
jgi:hypothetical protein